MSILSAEEVTMLIRSAVFLLVLIGVWRATLWSRQRRAPSGIREKIGVKDALRIGREHRLMVVQWRDREWVLATSPGAVVVLQAPLDQKSVAHSLLWAQQWDQQCPMPHRANSGEYGKGHGIDSELMASGAFTGGAQ